MLETSTGDSVIISLMMARAALILTLAMLAACRSARPPMIDMHLHAYAVDSQGPPPLGLCAPFPGFPPWDQRIPYTEAFVALLKTPPCSDPVWSPQTDAELQRRTLAELERYNIIAVTSGSAGKVAQWQRMAPRRILPAIEFQLGPNAPSIEALRELHALGRLVVIGEVTNQYAGIAPDDPKMEPYYQLAEELDLPIGLHIGTGPPGTP